MKEKHQKSGQLQIDSQYTPEKQACINLCTSIDFLEKRIDKIKNQKPEKTEAVIDVVKIAMNALWKIYKELDDNNENETT